MKTNPRVRLSPSIINRVALIDAAFRESDMRVFFYSPKHITSMSTKVPGYVLEGEEFIPTTGAIPRVNGNWTYQTRRLLDKGMGFNRFVNWVEEQQVEIYVPYAFSELVVNKYETYKLVQAYHETLHPHCEPYRRSPRQLEYFAERGDLTFIKPRNGNKGDRIVTLRREANGFSVKYYETGAQKLFTAKTLSASSDFIRDLTKGRTRYIIQRGVETLRYEGSVFDFRVIMLNDGRIWNWFHEARLSSKGSDLSNVSQGGVSLMTESLLFHVLGNEAGSQTLYELKSQSFGLASYLESIHPGDLMEIAFDFVLDREAKLHLIEINTKPGLPGVGFENSIFDKRPEQEPLFELWVYPYAACLARFLRTKVEHLGE